MNRNGALAWPVLGIIGFVLLLLCSGYVAILGFAISAGAPHAFRGDARLGLIFELIAAGLIVAALLLLRNAIRRLRLLRHPPLG